MPPSPFTRPRRGRDAGWRSRLVAAWGVCWAAGPGLVAAAGALSLVTGPLASVTAWSTKLMVDGLISHQPGPVVAAAVAALTVAGLVGTIAPGVDRYIQGELARRMGVLINDRLFTAIGSFQGLARFENPRVLDQIRAAQQSASMAVEPATTGLFSVLTNAISLIGVLVTVWLLAPAMAAILLAAAVPVMVAQLSLSRRYARMVVQTSTQVRQQILFGSLISDLRAIKETRLLGLVDFFKGRMLAAERSTNAAKRAVDRRELTVESSLALLSAVIASGGTVWAVYAAYQGRLSVGDVTAFIAAVGAALSGFVGRLSHAHQALMLLGNYLDVVAMRPDFPDPDRPGELPALSAHIELVDVWFRYNQTHPWVLRGVNLRIHHGESVALVGLNGAGKSTLIKLLCRFYDPNRGAILWDGVDIRTVPVTELRRRLGVLFQDFMEYDLTAAENIGMGDLTRIANTRQVGWAADTAGIGEKINALPHGYDTMLSRVFFTEGEKDDPENGVSLSGGQWQRVALARAFMRADRELLILDEPSSGLDAEAEYQINDRIRQHRQGRTSLLVSHRLSTVRDADQIIVLEDGEIVEEGAHDTLIQSGGRYAHLFSLQAQGYQDSNPVIDLTCACTPIKASETAQRGHRAER